MPIYEYKCSKCGKELEVMHKVNDPAPAECPECHAQASLERLVSRTSFQLKGGGWYSDLYSSKKSESATSSGTPSAAPAAATSTASPATATSTSSTPAAPASGSSGTGGASGGSTT